MNVPVRPHGKSHAEHKGHEINLCLLWAELEYDVKYAVWKRGKVTGAKGEALKPFELTDEDNDWMLRQFTSAVDDIRERLKPYMIQRSLMANDEILEQPTEFNITLLTDDGWIGSARSMVNQAHQYVVSKTLEDWAGHADATLAASYKLQASTFLRRLYSEANSYNLEESPSLHTM